MAHKSKISPAIFIVATLCFLLPFVSVSCNGQKVVTFTGLELATGTSVEQPQSIFGPAQQKGPKEKVDPEPLALLALICALAGLGLSFLGNRMVIAPAVSGALGALMLLLLQSKLNSDITKKAQGVFQLDWGAGYVLALLLFIAGAGWNFYQFFQSKKLAGAPAVSPPRASAAAAAASFCPHCGKPLAANSSFCGECGKAVG